MADLGCCVVHHLLGSQVTLVAHQQLVDVLAGVAVYLLEPLLHVVEGLLSTGGCTTLLVHQDTAPHTIHAQKNTVCNSTDHFYSFQSHGTWWQ